MELKLLPFRGDGQFSALGEQIYRSGGSGRGVGGDGQFSALGEQVYGGGSGWGVGSFGDVLDTPCADAADDRINDVSAIRGSNFMQCSSDE
jgi:hypothetical protein